MPSPATPWNASEMRALSDGAPIVQWPPRLHARIHLNTGWPHSSWSAEVRAVVDDDVALLTKIRPVDGKKYMLLTRAELEAVAHPPRYGALPRALCGASK